VRFSTPVQTGPGAHPAFCTIGTGSFLGVKRLGRGTDHPPPSSTEVKERVELYLYSPSGCLWTLLRWTLSLLFYFMMHCSPWVTCQIDRAKITTDLQQQYRLLFWDAAMPTDSDVEFWIRKALH